MPESGVTLREKFERLKPHMNEAGLRLWAANEALALGYGGVSIVSRATGMSRGTIHVGQAELSEASSAVSVVEGHSRRPGGGAQAYYGD